MMTSDRLYGIGVSQNYFTHLFADEAGHATEQLLALPLGLCKNADKIILAGDPKQLGPRVRAIPLIAAGLHISPLKRLMDDPTVWQKVGTQLLDNYRSHPDIIQVVNGFYDDKLRPAEGGRDHSNNKFLNWSRLPKKGTPILCINHAAPDGKEKDSPSWFNAFEVDTIKSIVVSLVFRHKLCNLKDIAVITPYTKQAQKIRDALFYLLVEKGVLADVRPRPALPISVSTVDSFQGRESNVVILSCVRSNVENAASNLRYSFNSRSVRM
jgi:helicase MOV-10